MLIDTNTKVCLVIGDPVAHSLSPAMHNAAYEALGLGSQYVFLPSRVTASELALKMSEVKESANIHALAVTVPHKETIIKYLNKLDETARLIGAVNTVVKEEGKLVGYNTDYYGAIESLKAHTGLNGKKVAVLGAGGSARAIVYGLAKEKCDVIIYSRNIEKGKEITDEFGGQSIDWEKRNNSIDCDIIINATNIGREGKELPLEEEVIVSKQIIFDINYNINGTALLNASKRKGAAVVDGLEMLLRQGMKQFEIYTGLKAPEEAMRNALNKKVNHANAI